MRSRHAVVIALSLGALLLPVIASAAIPYFGPIVPDQGPQCAGSWGLLMTVVNNLISVLITFAVLFVAPIMIAYAGFLFVVNPVNASGKEHAKSILTNTVVGIVIALSAYLIVNAVMATLYNPDASSGQTRLGVWYSLLTTNGDPCINVPSEYNPVKPSPTPTVPVVPGSADEQAVRARLLAAGVPINHDPCPPGSDGQGCTNVGGMQEATIQQIINLAAATNAASCDALRAPDSCPVIVTGGTEPGHAAPSAANNNMAHSNGYKVDLRPTSALTTYIKTFTDAGQRQGDHMGPAWKDSCNNYYVLETQAPSHWDATITKACGGGTARNTIAPRQCPASSLETMHFIGIGNPFKPLALQPGQIAAIELPTSYTFGGAGNGAPITVGQMAIGEMPVASVFSAPGSRLEVSISQCKGDFDYWINQPIDNPGHETLYPCHLDIDHYVSYTNIQYSLVPPKYPYQCYTPESAGPWYVNVRYTYPRCPYDACGYSFQWNLGG